MQYTCNYLILIATNRQRDLEVLFCSVHLQYECKFFLHSSPVPVYIEQSKNATLFYKGNLSLDKTQPYLHTYKTSKK